MHPSARARAVQLLVIRHAIAEDRSQASMLGLPDDQRRLTPKGRSRMRRGARGIARLVGHVDLAATSPLVRAVETTRIVAAACGDPPIVEVASLRPGGDRDEFLQWARTSGKRSVAVVGHEARVVEAQVARAADDEVVVGGHVTSNP